MTIAVSTVFSALNSLTLSPALAAILLGKKKRGPGTRHSEKSWKLPGAGSGNGLRAIPPDGATPPTPERHGVRSLQDVWSLLWQPVSTTLGLFSRGFNAAFGRTTAAYAWGVGRLLRVSVVVLLLYGALLALTYGMFRQAPRGFVPDQDQGRVIVSIQLPDAASLQRTRATLAAIDQIARKTPGVAHTITVGGYSFVQQSNGSNFASMFIVLDPFEKRTTPALRDTAIINNLSRQWSQQIKGARVIAFGSPPIPGLSVAGGFKLVIEDPAGLGLPLLEAETNAIVGKLSKAPGLDRVASQFRANTPELFMDIDRAKTAALGVSFNDLNQTLGIYLGSLYVNSFNAFGRHWQVNVQAEGDFRNRVSDVNLLQVRNNQGQMVPLGTLAAMREIGGPIFVYRYNNRVATSINGSLKPRVSSGNVIANVDRAAAETLPLSMKTEWTELMFMQIRAGDTTLIVFALAVMCVFLALSALYESWSLPLAVILVVPLCMLSSLAGVRMAGGALDIFVQIGLVVLVGLACKNSILVVEFARYLHQGEGRSRYEATVEASRIRLRPILMTSFAFILGVVPLVLATGAGSEMRRSLGTAVFSGMIGVTLFGIFLTPVFFYVIQGLSELRLFTGPAVQVVVSLLFGGLSGAAVGFLLAELGFGGIPIGKLCGATIVVRLALLGVAEVPMSVVAGAGLGILVGLAVYSLHRRIRTWKAGP